MGTISTPVRTACQEFGISRIVTLCKSELVPHFSTSCQASSEYLWIHIFLESKVRIELALSLWIHGTPFCWIYWYFLRVTLFSLLLLSLVDLSSLFNKLKKYDTIWRKIDGRMVQLQPFIISCNTNNYNISKTRIKSNLWKNIHQMFILIETSKVSENSSGKIFCYCPI